MFRSKLGLDSYIVIAKVAVMKGILVIPGFNQYAFPKTLSASLRLEYFGLTIYSHGVNGLVPGDRLLIISCRKIWLWNVCAAGRHAWSRK